MQYTVTLWVSDGAANEGTEVQFDMYIDRSAPNNLTLGRRVNWLNTKSETPIFKYFSNDYNTLVKATSNANVSGIAS